jgi:hypothetical protein
MARNILPKSDKINKSICINSSCSNIVSNADPLKPNISISIYGIVDQHSQSLSINNLYETKDKKFKINNILPNASSTKSLLNKNNSYNQSSDEDDKILISNEIMPSPKTSPNSSIVNFSSIKLNQWYTNEEIYNILMQCNCLNDKDKASISFSLCKDVIQLPNNGSVFFYDRRVVKNFKKDGFVWKRRKTGGINSVREDRMYLKVNGVDSIYGCYSHSSIMSTFHRRCYWLVEKPDIVLVHYLQTPNTETSECSISINANNIVPGCNNINTCNTETLLNGVDFQINKDDLISEIKAMLWPYYLIESFLNDNKAVFSDSNIKRNQICYNEFFHLIVEKLLKISSLNFQSVRISLVSFNNLSTCEILSKINENVYNKSKQDSGFDNRENRCNSTPTICLNEILSQSSDLFTLSKTNNETFNETSNIAENTFAEETDIQMTSKTYDNQVQLSTNSCLNKVC